jgi:hypothetical protein
MSDELRTGLKDIWENAEKLKAMEHFNFNEANTKEVIIRKVLALLGWRIDMGEVSMEYPVQTEKSTYSIDYALILKGDPKVIVECKALKNKLGENESTQVMKYAFYSEIPWGILTNGQQWIVTKPDYHEEFFRFDISKPEKSLKDIQLLTRDSLETGSLQDNFEDAYTAQVISSYL